MGTGGSRYRAGRPGWRRKCEYSLPFDIRRLAKRELLNAGSWFNWQWSREGDPFAHIGVQVRHDCIELRYTWTPYGHDPRSITCEIRIERTPCKFGGTRPWFICPDCGRRCALVYGISRYGNFACRVCQRLGYASEAEDTGSRLWRKQRKLEARLGEDGERPKGMRQQTYARLCDRLGAIEEAKDLDFMVGALALMRRTGIPLDEILK